MLEILNSPETGMFIGAEAWAAVAKEDLTMHGLSCVAAEEADMNTHVDWIGSNGFCRTGESTNRAISGIPF
jgi:hypothetical protein